MIIDQLTNNGLVKVHEGAQVISMEEFEKPLVVVKEDGGYNYASTDLTALWLVIHLYVVSE